MKIEIELDEVEGLREQVERLRRERAKLEDQIKDLNQNKLKERAVELSFNLLDKYLERVFLDLGFSQENWFSRSAINVDENLHLLDRWWTSPDLKINLGANIIGQFRRAFLNIGVVPKEKQKEKDVLDIAAYE